MRIKFIGAIERVTGSCTLLEQPHSNLRFLVDCGMAQGDPKATAFNQAPWPFVAAKVDFVLLTHAHLDHCGLLPRLVREGFSGPIYCTRFTAELALLNLMSAASMAGAPFTRMDVERLQFEHVDQAHGFAFGKPCYIAKDLTATFEPTAHIGGACSISVRWPAGNEVWKEMAFSGDLGPNTEQTSPQPLLAGRKFLSGAPQYLLVESTYGGREREAKFSDTEQRLNEWSRILRSAIDTPGSTVVVPCFSIHRCQELLLDLHAVLEGRLREELVAVRPWIDEDEHLRRALKSGLRITRVEHPIGLMYEWPDHLRSQFDALFERREEAGTDGAMRAAYRTIADDETTIASALDLMRQMRIFEPRRKIQIILDSPLAQKVTAVYRREIKRRLPGSDVPMYRNGALLAQFRLDSEDQLDALTDRILLGERQFESAFPAYRLRYCKPDVTEEVMKDADLNIVLSSSGMCDVGPIVPHLVRELPRSEATVVLTGYADPATVGGKLRNISRAAGNYASDPLQLGEVEIQPSTVKARIEDLGGFYSGHADSGGLIDFVFRRGEHSAYTSSSCRVFINHGDDQKRSALARAIQQRADWRAPHDCTIDGIEQPARTAGWFDLHTDKWIPDDPVSEQEDMQSLLLKLFLEQRRTNDLLAEILRGQRTQQHASKPGAKSAARMK